MYTYYLFSAKLDEVEKKQSDLQSKLENSVQNCDEYKCEIDGKVSEQIPEKFNELQADCTNEIKVKLQTCFHEFSDYESMNFFYYQICMMWYLFWFSKGSQLRKKFVFWPISNLLVTAKNETTNSSIHEFKVLQNDF